MTTSTTRSSNSLSSGRPVLALDAVTKRYAGSSTRAVDRVSFQVSAGEIVGLLGPNGAGKSTTIAMITTRIAPTEGEIRVAGVSAAASPAAVRAYLGVCGQNSTLDSACTVFENVYLHCRYHGAARREAAARAREALCEFGLEALGDRMPGALSGGVARRLQLARAMAHRPALLLLDEPTNELDVPSRELFWERVHGLRTRHGTAVLLATHHLEEAEEHCRRVLILEGGRVRLEGRPAELRRRFRGSTTLELRLSRACEPADLEAVAGLPGVVRCAIDDRRLSVLLDAAPGPLAEIVARLAGHGIEEVATRSASLREVFLEVVQGRHGAEAAS